MSYTYTEANNLDASAIEKLLGHGKAMAEPFEHPSGGKAVIVPLGYSVNRLDPIDHPLTHIKASHDFFEAQSFIDYVNEYAACSGNAETRTTGQIIPTKTKIFANRTSKTIKAIIDYHKPGVSAYCDHQVRYTLPHSDQWQAWDGINGKEIPQVAFAEFIEENALDIYEPDSATVLEVAKSLSIKSSVDFSSAVNLDDGAVQLKWVETQDGKGRGNIDVPRKIKLGLPVFQGDELTELWAFLRTRIKNGKLSFIVKMHRRELILNDAFDRVVAKIGEGTGIKPFYASF